MVPADSRRIPRAPRYSGYRYASASFAYVSVTLCGQPFQTVPLASFHATSRSYNPGHAVTWPVWALPRSLATTGGIIVYFLFLRVLRCFSSPRSPPDYQDGSPSDCRVVPFGNPRIKGHLHLPAAYRSLSRPSSPPRAKASAMRPYLLSFHRSYTCYVRDGIYFQLLLVALLVTSCHRPFQLWRITDSNR